MHRQLFITNIVMKMGLRRMSLIIFCLQYVSPVLSEQIFHGKYEDNLTARITDSSDAFPGEFPYQAGIVWGIPPFIKYRPICGGSIINENWILTSAECVPPIAKIGKIKVQVGKYFTNDNGEYVQTRNIAVRLVHSKYNSVSKENDIGLLKLESPLNFNERVQPIKLSTKDYKNKGNVSIVTGWGSISKQLWIIPPSVLQKAQVPIVENSICNDALSAVTQKFQIQESQLCTGPLTETISTCVGDLGGPLVQMNKTKDPVQIGIVSWNTYPCGKKGAPSVYTGVSSYSKWINTRINEV